MNNRVLRASASTVHLSRVPPFSIPPGTVPLLALRQVFGVMLIAVHSIAL